LGQDRRAPRRVFAAGMRQFLRRRRIRAGLMRIRSKARRPGGRHSLASISRPAGAACTAGAHAQDAEAIGSGDLWPATEGTMGINSYSKDLDKRTGPHGRIKRAPTDMRARDLLSSIEMVERLVAERQRGR
jgi:hypothetical protein